ncbi:TPA: hypothetical protein HA361_07380 [Candidatus Woesearchaeota archaeon]|nr:hypothetical protein [Candidatus Woesearchaeota archaeon]
MTAELKKKRLQANFAIAIVVAFLLLLGIAFAAVPEGPQTITVLNSTAKTPASAASVDAIGGNITSLNIDGTSSTQTWQGYVGNISGTLTLDDSAGFTLYNWTLANPEGEIYASNSSQIDFSDGNVECYNYTRTGGGYLDLAAYEASLGLAGDDVDGINETFILGETYSPFYVGEALINKACPEVQLFNAAGEKNPDDFQEVLLYDTAANAIIFTALIEEGGTLGYNTQRWDFQMIVAENGRSGDRDPTTYYFFVELE